MAEDSADPDADPGTAGGDDEGTETGDVEESEGVDDERGDGEGDDSGPAADDETAPSVELDLYQLSVSVGGRSDDDLADVAGTARDLMAYLVDESRRLEDRPDDRGLG